MMQNWKTTAAGVGTMLVALGHIATSLSHGGGIEAADIMAIVSAVGLLLASDAKPKA